MSRIDGERLLTDLRCLAQFGRCAGGVDRPSFSPEDVAARRWLEERMTAAGLTASIDGIGNVYGACPGAAPCVLIGSHTDTVPRGGWLDGALGVVCGLEVARSRLARGQSGVDVISFVDEEGSYHSLLGSKSFCGMIPEGGLAGARSADGRPLAAARAAAGFEGPLHSLDPQRHIAYLEAHIEQGPRLEAARRRIGAVTAICGLRRYRITAHGQADHAGTTPMSMRRDAGAAAIELAHALLAGFPAAGASESVWNIGAIAFAPGAANVVPAAATMSVELRDRDPGVMARMADFVEQSARSVAARFGMPVEFTEAARIDSVAMDAGLIDIVCAAAVDCGAPAMRMPSGAGHDAMVVGLRIPAAMLFIPSIGGRSHDVAEDSAEADIVLGCEVLAGAVERVLAGR